MNQKNDIVFKKYYKLISKFLKKLKETLIFLPLEHI
jgi:hypothetical protein